ncbi:MAG TPA: N-acetyl-gamma-glutamyl-phosphate reductase [Pirellulales bacterium]|jgi:N-acetyl-gamma-glutamyl-phosphate reductase
MTRVAILGATGYSALEAIKLLLRHPQAEITAVTSRQEGNPPISQSHPSLVKRLELPLEDLAPEEIVKRADCVFSCLPHGVTSLLVPQLLAGGARVVDFSADYRLRDPAVFAKWYGEPHNDPGRLADAVYGLPELFRESIKKAKLIANPGCYPTSAILALAPLLKAGVIETGDILIDSKSGISGAGRTLKLGSLFAECNESVAAYNVGKHRHTPEIEQILSTASGQPIEVIFTPHLIPMDRGILTTAYSRPKSGVTEKQLLDTLREFYAKEPFVRVVEHLPSTKETTDTNYCDVTVRLVRGRVITISVIDNLIKGAAGAAVQNFNLMYGYPETTAL